MADEPLDGTSHACSDPNGPNNTINISFDEGLSKEILERSERGALLEAAPELKDAGPKGKIHV
jgi:hypothetical protein